MRDRQAWRPLAIGRTQDLCADEKRVARMLWPFKAFSNIAVVCGIAVPILAGSTVLASTSGVGGSWLVVSGWLTLVTSVLVALHKGLNCDTFHAACHEALAGLRSFAMRFERLLNAPAEDDGRAAFELLDRELEDFYGRFARILPVRPTRVIVAPTE